MQLPDYKEARKRNKTAVEKEYYEINDNLINIGLNKTYHVKTYGCQMNEHDTENIKAMLEQLGFIEEDDMFKANLVILNTCSIRENAHNKAFGMLGRLKHAKEESNKKMLIGLCGCMAQEEKVVTDIMKKYKYVNFVFGTHNIHHLPFIIDKAIKTKKQVIEVFSKEGNIVEGVPAKRRTQIIAESEFPTREGILVWNKDGQLRSQVLLPGETIIGRADSNEPSDISLEDNTASRRSVKIVVTKGELSGKYNFKLTVLRTTNAVYVNNNALYAQSSIYLNYGDNFKVGETVFTLIAKDK